MNDLRELYQEVILDHNKAPRNKGELEHPTSEADGYNPLCGDKIHLYLDVEDGIVKDVRFTGSGCAISTASASLMTEAVKGKRVEDVDRIFEKFHAMVTDQHCADPEDDEDLESLAALAGVKEFPVRVKCATLAWHTLNQALKGGGDVASTE
jgi:nitrogen fixation NifU-like protein